MRRAILVLFASIIAACARPDAPSSAAVPPAHAQLGRWGVDLSNIDTSVSPAEDFYRYVNGRWLAKTKIPDDRTGVGSFEDLQILSETRGKTILAELDHHDPAKLTVEERKIRDLYDAYMDTTRLAMQGVTPAQPDITYLQGLGTLDDIARAMGSTRRLTDGPFGVGIGIDDKHPDHYSVNIGQSGLGLPDRDYYLRNDTALVTIRDAYRKHLATMLRIAGQDNVDARATAVLALEQQIATASWPAEDRRDAERIYNIMTVSELEKLAPQFPWRTMLNEAGIPLAAPAGERQVIVAEKSAFPKLAAVFARTPVPVWRDYLIAHYMHSVARYLSPAIADSSFAFFGRVLNGQQQQLPRDTRAFYLIDNDLGEALGKIYVARYFPPEAKAKAETLVQNLKRAMAQEIDSLSWMSDSTRARALDKLAHFTTKIGYPDKWRDYSALQVDRNNLLVSAENAAVFSWNRRLARLDQPVDRAEWGMTPPTINAYYNPTFNEIVFPAAILQPPFFDPHADDAVNYGGIGMVIGHEISHGFDDQGSKYDGRGVLQNWWSASDRKNFDERTGVLVKQYGSYEALPGLKVNGKLTLGENIGDLAGVTIASRAYQLSLNGKPAPVVDGFSGMQRFYLGFGQVWREALRDGAMRSQVLSDPHAPSPTRVNGVVRNLDSWYKAFAIEPGARDYLKPEDRVRLW